MSPPDAGHGAGSGPLPRFAGLHVLADDDPRWPCDPVEQASAALAGGAPVVQLRVKHATDATALAWAARIRELCSEANSLFVMNDRVDLALASDADAVHLGQEDLPPGRMPAEARARLGVGRSTHTLEQAHAAVAEGVDYLAFGPVFETGSKDSPYSARGTTLLSEVAKIAAPDRIVVAIGGIGEANLGALVAAGAGGAAVISAVAGAEDPVAATRALTRHSAWETLRSA